MDMSYTPPKAKPPVERRSRAAMQAMRGEIRTLAASGVSRRRIAQLLGCTPAQVTQTLGALRQYRGLRLHVDL